MEIKLKIQDKGRKEGTSKWAKNVLENGELFIARTKHNEPCISFKENKDSRPKILCFIPTEYSKVEYHQNWIEYGECFVRNSQEESMYEESLFTILTPKADTSVWNFLKDCCNILEEYWNADTVEEIQAELV